MPSERDKKVHEHILWIHKSKDERLTLMRVEWNIFLTKLQELVLAGKPYLKINWQRLVWGVGILTPMDKESQTITQEIVRRIKVAENSLRAWAKGDKDTNLTVKLPSTMNSITSG